MNSKQTEIWSSKGKSSFFRITDENGVVRFESDNNGNPMPPGVYKLTYDTVVYYANKLQQVGYGQAKVNSYSMTDTAICLLSGDCVIKAMASTGGRAPPAR